MKNQTPLYIVIACLSAGLIALATVFIMDHRGSSTTEIVKNNNSGSAFDTKGFRDDEVVFEADTNLIDTFKRQPPSLPTPTKNLKTKVSATPSLIVSFDELYPDESEYGGDEYAVVGKIARVDDNLEGAYVMEKGGVLTYVNFDFMNITTGKKDMWSEYIQVGRQISAICKEEGRTFVANSFKIW